MDKIKIVLSGLYYPFAILSYFKRALERRDDVELFSVGAFTGQYIPWNGGMQIPLKYENKVDLPLPPNMLHPSWEMVKYALPWKPDVSLTIDAGWFYSTKLDCLSAHVATDPHVLQYDRQRELCDIFYNMQPSYLKGNDHLLPYAFDPSCHYPDKTYPVIEHKTEYGDVIYYETLREQEYDCCMVGLHYAHRDEWVSRLRAEGITVNYRIGDIYDEYREENNKAKIGLIWSSMQDVIARVFEVMAMRMIPVMNRLPGLDFLGFEDGRHYLGFSTMEEAVMQVKWAKEHPDFANQIANNAYQFVHEHNMTYDQRINQILKETKLLV
jgi:hypothetical protein